MKKRNTRPSITSWNSSKTGVSRWPCNRLVPVRSMRDYIAAIVILLSHMKGQRIGSSEREKKTANAHYQPAQILHVERKKKRSTPIPVQRNGILVHVYIYIPFFFFFLLQTKNIISSLFFFSFFSSVSSPFLT